MPWNQDSDHDWNSDWVPNDVEIPLHLLRPGNMALTCFEWL